MTRTILFLLFVSGRGVGLVKPNGFCFFVAFADKGGELSLELVLPLKGLLSMMPLVCRRNFVKKLSIPSYSNENISQLEF